MTSSGEESGRVGVALGEAVGVDDESKTSADEADAAGVESDAATAVGCVSAYGESVLESELGAALTRLNADGELSERECAVLSAMATRIVGRVLPAQGALRAREVDAWTVRQLFADDARIDSRDDA